MGRRKKTSKGNKPSKAISEVMRKAVGEHQRRAAKQEQISAMSPEEQRLEMLSHAETRLAHLRKVLDRLPGFLETYKQGTPLDDNAAAQRVVLLDQGERLQEIAFLACVQGEVWVEVLKKLACKTTTESEWGQAVTHPEVAGVFGAWRAAQDRFVACLQDEANVFSIAWKADVYEGRARVAARVKGANAPKRAVAIEALVAELKRKHGEGRSARFYWDKAKDEHPHTSPFTWGEYEVYRDGDTLVEALSLQSEKAIGFETFRQNYCGGGKKA